ncbi:MAG: tripartite tricarboxylate transporter TctB family protein [Armatimonadota bacterium]|nr:tripartite tricarboxylate transporter TctB family protein [Armatimonadota bacterium]
MSSPARLAVAAAIAAFAVAAIVLAQQIPTRHVRGDPGPRALPVASGAIVLAGAVLVMVTEPRRGGVVVSEVPWQAALVLAGATVAYLVLMVVAGFVLATAVFLLGASRYLDGAGRHPLLVHAAVAAAASLAAWFVFGRLLEVALPAGPWGF